MEFTLTEEEKKTLLADCRETIAARLEKREAHYKRSPELARAITEERSAFAQPCGAFVTLHKGKSLRGCIGRMTATDALEKTVRIMAVEAAFGDPRFPPLRPEELSQCHIEISALSPMSLCPDPASVEVGLHGLYLIHRGRSGVLLPQVPVEQDWDREQYLEYISIKAGLPPGSHEAEGAKLYTFTALVFGET